ncbi:MAG: hypothetical protein ABJF23_34140 [Bryobacteraceae bacterium]
MKKLLAVEAPDESIGEWKIFAKNNQVLKGWEWLFAKAPENTRECFYQDHKGSWEYEVTKRRTEFSTRQILPAKR